MRIHESYTSKQKKIPGSKKSKLVKMPVRDTEIEIELSSSFDFNGFDKKTIIDWYKLMHLGRILDEKAALYLKMAKGWSYHASCAGHEGIQLALGMIFRQGKDYLFPYYRDLMTSLAAGITPVEIILNGLSKETDVAGGGRHMSNHFAKPSINIQNVSSCTGNHAQHAAGLGRAIKKYDGDEIVYYSSGESACSEGYFFEALNAASLEKLPVVFVIQNNKYGISVPLDEATANIDVSENYRGIKNLNIVKCDGRDPFDSYRAMETAKLNASVGLGPSLVHADCDRIHSHSNSDRQELYRSAEELEEVARRDPLMQFRYNILSNKMLSEKEIIDIESKNKEIMFAAADKAEAAPEADGKSYEEFLLPKAYAIDEIEGQSIDNGRKLSYLEAINHTLDAEFEKNENLFLWGQDIGKGGIFNVVKGLPEKYGKRRIFNSPVAENSIVGTANGFSRYRDDIRVVIEGAEFADYFWPAMEQLVELSHEYWRTKGQYSPNITIRLASGGYIQGGLYHSQNIEGTLATMPGIRVVMPAFADDAAGLLRNSIRSGGVTVFLEPKFLYNYKSAYAPEKSSEYAIAFGKAKIRRAGSDVTIVTFGTAVHLSLRAAAEMAESGISCEVIDLRSLIPWDKQAVYESVKKTNRVVIAHEDKTTGGFGGEISSSITQDIFSHLDSPVMRVGSKNTPVGFAISYEKEILLSVSDIKAAVSTVLKY